MSLKNRKSTYDKLVQAGRFSHIDAALSKEFGDPEQADVSYSDKTKKELKEDCAKAELEFDSKATKDDLVVLLKRID